MSFEPQRAASPTRGPQWFATTHWSVVLSATDSSAPGAQEALEKLCCSYWYPLYAFVRREGYSPEDAQDLTQAFFARFLEKNYLAQVDREKGKFRSFLLASLRHFLSDETKVRWILEIYFFGHRLARRALRQFGIAC